MKLISKNGEGLRFLLHQLNVLDDHNISFYRRTFEYMTKKHPPYNKSYIYYHPDHNMFKFISHDHTLITQVKPASWEIYNPYSTYWIREDTFGYLSINPFIVVVSNAQFLLEYKSVDADKWAHWYKKYMDDHIHIEREIWKAKLSPTATDIKPLF